MTEVEKEGNMKAIKEVGVTEELIDYLERQGSW